MKEAISKYTALEVLHVVGPKREEEPGDRCPSRGARRQDVGSPAPPCWLVRAAAGASSGAPGPACSWLWKESGSLLAWVASGWERFAPEGTIAHVSGAITM